MFVIIIRITTAMDNNQIKANVRYGTFFKIVRENRMDRRQQKTKKAIFLAFSRLLEKKRYSHITVQNIIDEANIGRSTFYAHFETKDELLNAMCTAILEHIFSDDLIREETHDFSGNRNLQARLTHLLYHLKEKEQDISSILSGDSNELFMRYFKDYLTKMFAKQTVCVVSAAPKDYVLNHYVSSFAETVKWWVEKDMSYSPYEVIGFYMNIQREQASFLQ